MKAVKPAWHGIFFSSALLCLLLGFSPPPLRAQEQGDEIVANLAAGQVVIYVAGDGIAIGALENQIEPGTRPPFIVPLGHNRVGILLGAVDWVLPSTGRPVEPLNRALPRLVARSSGARPRLQEAQANDIEEIGLAVLEPLRKAAQLLHGKLDLPPNEPLAELLLVGYVENYGPEVWNLEYRAVQEPLRGDYWQTRVLRPTYTQLYPPEKGHPHTLIEVRYPPSDMAPMLLELLDRPDPRLARIASADPQMARAVERLRAGDTRKARALDAAAFLRASLAALAPEGATQAVALLDQRSGFQWILPPPETPETAETQPKSQEPGAPTLRKKPD